MTPIERAQTLVLGGGPAGLTAASLLRRHGSQVVVAEKAAQTGGLTRTIEHEGFRFDLGGHRFYSKNPAVCQFFADVIGADLIEVDRISRIHFRSRFIDYPIKPWNALTNVGLWTAARIFKDLLAVSLRKKPRSPQSLEEWMIANYGRTLFETYFKVYAEKVWGLRADDIHADLAAQRVKGLDLWATIRNGLFPRSKRAIESMVDRFHYARWGYGQFCENLTAELAPFGCVRTETEPVRICHDGSRVLAVDLRSADGQVETLRPDHVLSSIPVPRLMNLLDPVPPEAVQRAVAGLGFRAVVFVAVFVDRPTVRPESWIYFPSPEISFGRITEPRNWSDRLAPDGKTSIVAEHFCDRGDATWRMDDAAISERTIADLTDKLGFFRRDEVIGSKVVRVAAAYPRMDKGHKRRLAIIEGWLEALANLQVIGRGGMFRYHNTDHVIETAFAAVDRLRGGAADPRCINTELTYHEETRIA